MRLIAAIVLGLGFQNVWASCAARTCNECTPVEQEQRARKEVAQDLQWAETVGVFRIVKSYVVDLPRPQAPVRYVDVEAVEVFKGDKTLNRVRLGQVNIPSTASGRVPSGVLFFVNDKGGVIGCAYGDFRPEEALKELRRLRDQPSKP